MTTRDRAYVVSTWAAAGPLRGSHRRRRAVIDAVLDGGARVVVLATGDTVHAFAVADSADAVLFVYVPFDLRGRKFARRAVIALIDGYPDPIRDQIRARAIALAKEKAA